MARLRVCLAGLLLLLLIGSPRVFAQTPAPRGLSDVLVLVHPTGITFQISVTFANPIPHARAKRLLADLAKRGGWKLGAVEVVDELVPADMSRPGETVKQTGLSSEVSGEPLTSGGAYRLQPFVEAFAEFKQLELLYLDSEDPTYAGLRDYAGGAVKVELIKAGAPYRFLIRIDRAAGPISKLPLTQPAPPVRIAEAPAKVPENSSKSSMAYVLLVSAASGLAVFFSLLLLSHLRSRRVNRMRFRRPSRP